MEVLLLRHGMHEETIADILKAAADAGVPTRSVANDELNGIAHTPNHGGVILICSDRPRTTLAQLHEMLDRLNEPPLLLLLEGVDDARNLGFTLRTADALGFHAVLIKKHLWDFDPVELARPASGASERLPLVQIDEVAPLRELQKRGIQIVACLAGAKRAIDEVDLRGPTLLVVGGEKRGVSGAVRELCDVFATIPSRPDPSSLSLSHAGAIVMAEAARQRRVRAAIVPPSA